ncbi:Gfo/Idh/MocA family oxidoreductase [Prochlorococcus marinus]|uniref:Gfo/Idh/MocA-like oxidoreductase N-terminal domain-containing protein n=1 Tax=Prochlorococcus marinus (strain AS9601) TaxID=146891 RepID=A2BS63_PROMS|nr:Gfo/Idh/MocA family oxidoreductase [Prochlorococcus marinus]ABM70624.1 Hypothetical protein A9601_13401 [Prochlorococcus marinus str. AS9601]
MKKKQVLIIGYGSIGKKYGDYLKDQDKYDISIVDPSSKALKEAKTNNFEVFEELNEKVFKNQFDYGIVSNWGPDHTNTCDLIIKNQIEKITVEKPFCNNLFLGEKLLEKINRDKIKVNVHFRWPYIGLIEEIQFIEKKFNLGTISSINIIGGANCLSTGGIHWMDFACRHFKSMPKIISSLNNCDKINPRSKELIYIDGSSVFIFENNKRLFFNLDNNSSIASETKLVYKHGYITIDSKSIIRVYKRNKKEIEIAENQITRYGIANLIYESKILQNKSSIPNVVEEIFDDNKNEMICSAFDGLRASRMLILCLESSKLGKQLNYHQHAEIEFNNSWNIS